MPDAPQKSTKWWLPGCVLGLTIFLLVNLNDLIGLFTGQAASAPMIAMTGQGTRFAEGEAAKVMVQSGVAEENTASPGLALPPWPPRDEAFLQAQQVFLDSGDLKQARAVAQEMEAGPARDEAWRRLAAASLDRGQLDQAAELAQQIAPGLARDQVYETLIQKTIDVKYGAERANNPFSEPLGLNDFENTAQAQAWFGNLLTWTRRMSDSPSKVKRLGQLASFMESLFRAGEEARGSLPTPENLRQEALEVARRTEGPEAVSLSRNSRLLTLLITAIASAALGMIVFNIIGSMLQRLAPERGSKS